MKIKDIYCFWYNARTWSVYLNFSTVIVKYLPTKKYHARTVFFIPFYNLWEVVKSLPLYSILGWKMLWSKMTPWRNIWNVTSFETNYTQLTNYRCSNNILTTLPLWGPIPVLVYLLPNSSLSWVDQHKQIPRIRISSSILSW